MRARLARCKTTTLLLLFMKTTAGKTIFGRSLQDTNAIDFSLYGVSFSYGTLHVQSLIKMAMHISGFPFGTVPGPFVMSLGSIVPIPVRFHMHAYSVRQSNAPLPSEQQRRCPI